MIPYKSAIKNYNLEKVQAKKKNCNLILITRVFTANVEKFLCSGSRLLLKDSIFTNSAPKEVSFPLTLPFGKYALSIIYEPPSPSELKHIQEQERHAFSKKRRNYRFRVIWRKRFHSTKESPMALLLITNKQSFGWSCLRCNSGTISLFPLHSMVPASPSNSLQCAK